MRIEAGIASFALFASTADQAQHAPPMINEPVAIAPVFDAHMQIVNIAPAGDGPLTTAMTEPMPMAGNAK